MSPIDVSPICVDVAPLFLCVSEMCALVCGLFVFRDVLVCRDESGSM